MHLILDNRQTKCWDEAAAFCRGLMRLEPFAEIAAEMRAGAAFPLAA